MAVKQPTPVAGPVTPFDAGPMPYSGPDPKPGPDPFFYKKGGKVKKMAKGGKVKINGCAMKGHTRAKYSK